MQVLDKMFSLHLFSETAHFMCHVSKRETDKAYGQIKHILRHKDSLNYLLLAGIYSGSATATIMEEQGALWDSMLLANAGLGLRRPMLLPWLSGTSLDDCSLDLVGLVGMHVIFRMSDVLLRFGIGWNREVNGV